MSGLVTLSRRAVLRFLGGSAGALAVSACLPGASRSAGDSPKSQASAVSFNPLVANSELVKGRNRFAMGLIGEGNRPITDAQVSFAFFQLVGEQAIKKAESPATFRWIDLETKGLYAANVEFDTSGRWGVEVTAARPNSAPETARLPLEVRETGQAPTIGTAAPRSKTPTTNDVKDLSEICSNGPPCELHTFSVDEALSNGKPSVILFASPGFCVTATCAPELSVVLQTRSKQAERANFVHVEIFKDPRNRVVADAVTQWNLPSEPWVFIADRTGAISDRFEGLATADELDQALQAVL